MSKYKVPFAILSELFGTVNVLKNNLQSGVVRLIRESGTWRRESVDRDGKLTVKLLPAESRDQLTQCWLNRSGNLNMILFAGNGSITVFIDAKCGYICPTTAAEDLLWQFVLKTYILTGNVEVIT